MEFTSKKSLIQTLKTQIATRDNQAIKALITVFNNQTEEEQMTDNVEVYNNMGFTPFDAEFMSSLAKQYINKNYLSSKQLSYVKKIMPKYARQLIEQSIQDGKIIKNGKFYTWSKENSSNIKMDIEWKNEFARIEAEQERQAFLSDPDYRNYLRGE